MDIVDEMVRTILFAEMVDKRGKQIFGIVTICGAKAYAAQNSKTNRQ
jgi:hypothetical protein